MQKVNVTIQDPAGLHTRPATILIKKAKEFDSDITLEKDGQVANAKSIVKLLKLGITHGEVVILAADGHDEKEALEALAPLLAN